MMRKEEKTKIIEENRLHDTDTGSAEVQVAILTKRINELTEHLKANKNDHHSITLAIPMKKNFYGLH